MNIRERLSGNDAVAHAMKQINPDVVAAFPITPSTEICMTFSRYAADGLVDTRFIPVESEHSAMSACIGAEAAGARTMTATSSNGLALMWEMLYIAASCRLPITLAVVNRALSGPINIHNDYSDSMGTRDAGWIQIYSENNQEAYDNFIQAVRIGEHPDVRLPVMVCQDGFITSHAVENIELLDDASVKNFVGPYSPEHFLLDDSGKMAVGPYDSPDYYLEHKRLQAEGILQARRVITEIASEFKKTSGRTYGHIESYRMEDADIGMVIMGSGAGTAKAAVDKLRDRGIKAGVVKVRVFRPFPRAEIARAAGNVKALAVMDKSEGFSGAGGPLYADTIPGLYEAGATAKVVNYIYGLGGRDVKLSDIEEVFMSLEALASGNNGKSNTGVDAYRYLAVRD
jgi:pyruvate ferredoxin oxidoreductase alpha subunit